tara:strand:+ start:946 stop:2100 length:1155 start_codon:yes stop_codon:yes gene_type:complete
MKILFIGIILLILFGCSSNPKITNKGNLEALLIEKPQINYKLNSLPKDINVIYFADSTFKKTFPDEIKGLLTNYYSFSKKKRYFPTFNFIDLNKKESCDLTFNRNAYNFIFLLEENLNNTNYDLCLEKFITKDTLLVSNFDNQLTPKEVRKFIVNRNEDKLELIKFMDLYSYNIIVIDNEATNDKFEIGEIWKKNFNKKIAEYKTFNKTESSQDIFSNLLLSEQSLKRKRKLSRTISKDIEHKSRTRQDIDTLFLSVNIQEARGLKPALDYNYFNSMEVFLASDWEGDIQFLNEDKDLEGVTSIDFPFMLPITLPEDLKVLQTKTRNFAIGYDAFEIVLLLKSERNLKGTNYKGLTGVITFNDKTIKRKSTIFRIKNGNFEFLN